MTAPPSPTVFVVDDYAPVRSAISRLLRAAGFAVAAFTSPEKFLAQYDPHTPGCLVLQRILATKGSVLPIIFLTGHGDIPKSVQAMKRGASDFLTKPVNDKDLLAAVRVAIERDALARREQAKLSEICARLDTLTRSEEHTSELQS